ncbi:PA2169 family four-helix-bundle protein [Vulgatibacter incomptus]|uniref:DUF2383 domain-containing protein n=1 Tax=Vulgatibacter incomptus TaxID=1391653 RepID=A0A0K1P9N3_9BACT|nr:PA2169 family four-helix-bundle protein [Vulgatibacter incomptus]AKU90238.1 hypothetical protein AKJ08_0625 [Vulgatibacter incomptus]
MVMMKNKMIEQLNELIKLDLDAIGSYDEAIQEISLEPVRAKLREFQNDHRNHVTKLSAAVQALGGKAPERGSAKGFFVKQLTNIRAKTGNEGAIRAMQANETHMNSVYAKAAKEDFTPDLRSLVEHNFRDEQKHLAYVQQCVTNRVWEEAAAHP